MGEGEDAAFLVEVSGTPQQLAGRQVGTLVIQELERPDIVGDLFDDRVALCEERSELGRAVEITLMWDAIDAGIWSAVARLRCSRQQRRRRRLDR